MKQMRILQAMNMVDDEYLEEMNPENKTEPRRKGKITKILLVAALIAVLGFGVLAHEYVEAGEDWFRSFFSAGDRLEVMGKLTDEQKAVLSRGMVKIDQSVTVDGWTITMESGISDGYRMFVKYRIDGPEGVVLDGEQYTMEGMPHYMTPDGKEIDFGTMGWHHERIPDDDPNDNSMAGLYECTYTSSNVDGFAFPDGFVWTYEIDAIWEDRVVDGEWTDRKLCEGKWKFEVVFNEEYIVAESVELVDEPVYCAATRLYKHHEFDVKVRVTSFELRALTATVRYEKPLTGWWHGVSLKPIYIVLKDGSVVEARWISSGRISGDDYYEAVMGFDRPVALADVDYIDFP